MSQYQVSTKSRSPNSLFDRLKRSQDQLDATAGTANNPKRRNVLCHLGNKQLMQEFVGGNENAKKATKMATTTVQCEANKGDPRKCSMRQIVDDVNQQCGTSLICTIQTITHYCAIEGHVNKSPKRGLTSTLCSPINIL